LNLFVPFSDRSRSWEPKAQQLRNLLRLRADDILDPFELAPKVGLTLMEVFNIPVDDDLRAYLLDGAGGHWSAGVHATPLPDGTYLCILNPTHDLRRQRISLMEEISHVFLRHKPTTVQDLGGGLSNRDFLKAQEEEAYGVGAAAIMPWATFFHDLKDGMSVEEIAEKYNISTALVIYRISTTGATNLHRSRQKIRRVRRTG
jgi:Mor family transcriptional regulator